MPGAMPPSPFSPRPVASAPYGGASAKMAAAVWRPPSWLTAVPYRNPFPSGGGAAGVTWLRHLAVRLAAARAGGWGPGPGRARPAAAAAAGDGDLLRRRQLFQPAGEGAPGRRLLPQVRAAARPASAPPPLALCRCRGRASLIPVPPPPPPGYAPARPPGWGRLRPVPVPFPPALAVLARPSPGTSGPRAAAAALCFPQRRGPALGSLTPPEIVLAAAGPGPQAHATAWPVSPCLCPQQGPRRGCCHR